MDMAISRSHVKSSFYTHGSFFKEIMFLLCKWLDLINYWLSGVLKYFAAIFCIEDIKGGERNKDCLRYYFFLAIVFCPKGPSAA